MQFKEVPENVKCDNGSVPIVTDLVDFIATTALAHNSSIRLSTQHAVSTPTYILIWVTAVNVLMFVVGVTGNVMVTVIVSRVRTMRLPNNFFLVSLSIADLLVLLICLPSALLEFYAKDRWYLGSAMCKLGPFLESTAQKASVLTIAAISFERYNAICRPLRAQYMCSRSRSFQILATLWIVAALVSCPFAQMTVLEDALFFDGTPVEVCRTKIYEVWHFVYVIVLIVLFFAIPLITLVLLYSKIMFRLMSDFFAAGKRDDRRALKKLRSRQQSVYMLLTIIVLFFVGLTPARVFVLWAVFAPLGDQQSLGFEGYVNLLCFIRVMVYFNSAVNPVVYSLMSVKFRQAFKSLLSCRRHSRSRATYSLRYLVTTTQPKQYCVLQTPSGRPQQTDNDQVTPSVCKLHIVSVYLKPELKMTSKDSADDGDSPESN